MNDELKSRMARLRALAPRLNSATDQAARLGNLVEKFLVEELRMGISAESSPFNSWSMGADEVGNEQRVIQTLVFGRASGGYRLHVVEAIERIDAQAGAQDVISRKATLWSSCGRETKLRAVDKLPELLDKITLEAERLAETAGASESKIGAMIGDAPDELIAPELSPRVLTCVGCGEKGTLVNVRCEHWCTCANCELKWPIGRNLIPAWQDESEQDWKRNSKLLGRYSEAD